MLEKEIRLRCIEAAAKAPIVHQDGPVIGVIEAAQLWFDWISRPEPLTLGTVTPPGMSALF